MDGQGWLKDESKQNAEECGDEQAQLEQLGACSASSILTIDLRIENVLSAGRNFTLKSQVRILTFRESARGFCTQVGAATNSFARG
jgi:hypothetical protein